MTYRHTQPESLRQVYEKGKIGEGHYFWYECNGIGCDFRTPRVAVGRSTPDVDEMRAWKHPDYHDVHLCPECRKKYEQAGFDKAKAKGKLMVVECSRCGDCCRDVGRTFWKSIALDVELLKKLDPYFITKLNNRDHEDNNLPCELLGFKKDAEGEDSEAACRMQTLCGFKPSACRDYQSGERCVRNK